MHPTAIHSDQQYQAAMAALRDLEGFAEGTPQAALFETWAILIDAYEAALIEPSKVDPIDLLKASMEMTGRTRADLNAVIGETRASEVINRRRRLTLDMIRNISAAWDIPPHLLIADYELDRKTA